MNGAVLRCKKKHLLCPVTALQFVGKLLLAGEGPDVFVYDTSTSERCHGVEVFTDATVHGIRILADVESDTSRDITHVCVFGSKCVRILVLHIATSRLEVICDVVTLEDWVWDVAWMKIPLTPRNKVHGALKTTTDSTNKVACETSPVKDSSAGRSFIGCPAMRDASLALACVLGHNSVCYLDLADGKYMHHVHCEEKCILYSASSIGETWEKLVVASGTVFNQVVLWKPNGPRNTDGRALVSHRLNTHEGVIFSVHYNPLKSMLASVSDDRSIRLWRISVGEKTQTNVEDTDVQSTENPLLHHDFENLDFSEEQVLYGHFARVWDVKLLQQYIISIGEDSTCCVWDYTGEVIQKYKGHKGKSIWSLAVSEDETLMATGGGDTSIRLWPVTKETILQTAPTHTHCLQIPQENDGDFPRIVCRNGDCVLTMTNEGVLWKYDTVSSSWEKVFEEDLFKSYSVLSTARNPGVFAVGNICGLMKVFIQNRCIQLQAHRGKIHSLLWLYSEDQPSNMNIPQLMTTGPDGKITIWQIDVASHAVVSLSNFVLPYTKQRWVTAALALPQQNVVLCGDRGGTLHVYHVHTEAPVQSLWKVHGKTGVTDICCHGDQVYSAGRDGQYRVFLVENSRLQLLSVHKVYKGFEWISRLLVTEEGMLALGFHTDQFVAYSVTTNQKLLSIPCGGGHRAWDFVLDPQSGLYHFVYIKTKDIIHCQGHLNFTQRILKASLHGRDVCVVKQLFSDEDCHIVATAGEDTLINLLRFKGDGVVEVVGRLQGHLSSVRALAVCREVSSLPGSQTDHHSDTGTQNLCKNASRKTVMFSAGGRAEIKAWCIYGRGRDSNEMNNDSHNGQYHSCDLHGSDKSLPKEENCDPDNKNVQITFSKEFPEEKCSRCGRYKDEAATSNCWFKYLGTHSLTQCVRPSSKSWKSKNSDPDPETRYMDLSAFCVSELNKDYPSHLYIIMAACSDGFVRLLAFNEVTGKFTLLAASEFHNHCVLKVKHLIFNNASVSGTNDVNFNVLLVTAGTDGKIALWDVNDIVDAYVTYQCVTGDGAFPTGGVLQAGSITDSIDFGSVIDLSEPIVSVAVHQSGINSLELTLISDHCFLVASGGDDNMLAVSTFQVSHWESKAVIIQNTAKTALESVHSAQITGMFWLEKDLLLSVSIDQRLCVWNVNADNTELILKLSRFINVSDVSSCDVWKSRTPGHHVAVSGVGLQYLQLE